MNTKLAATVLSALTIVILPAPAQAAPVKKATCIPAPVTVSHRGGSEHYTENTRNAFRDTGNMGVNFWETDVRFTSDDVPVIMHDETVDRTTNGSGLVADHTLAMWRNLRTEYGEDVPTLANFLNDASVDRAYSFVELKTTPTNQQWINLGAVLDAAYARVGPLPVITSFSTSVLDDVASRLPRYTRGLIQSTGDAEPADITPHASVLLKHHDSITYGRLTKWTGAGLKVYAWADPAADPLSEWVRMTGYGTLVSGYITSSPQAYREWTFTRGC